MVIRLFNPFRLGFILVLTLPGSLALFSTLAARDGAKPRRQPWTTSRVVGTPDPPPRFKTPVAFPNLKFNHPLLMARLPGSNRLFVGEQDGRIYSFENRSDAKAELFIDLKKEVKTVARHPGAKEIEALYGLAFHPRFRENRECFVCYTLRGKKGEKNLPDGSRVSRFKVTDASPPRIDPGSEDILLTFPQGGHNGGDLHFGPDGYLYVSTGDATDPNPPDVFRTGQDVTDLLSSILRIDVDRKDAGLNYAVPKDNPFVGLKVGDKPARPEVWAFGFRNPWRMSFDRKTGDLWVGDVGWERWELVYKIEKGGNYGWSVVEGRQPVNTSWPVGPTPVRPPVVEIDHALGASVTGGFVYRGKKFPLLVGKYVFGDWSSRRFWAAAADGDRLVSLEEITDPAVRVVAFGEDDDGELYFLDYDAGTVHTLAPNDAAKHDPAKFPRTLSATGLFASTGPHTPAGGVYRFEVASPQWADGATAERFVALPGTAAVTDNEERRAIPGNVDWHQFKYHFPKDAVLAKTFALPDSGKRIETQVLHFDGENWRGYSYAWRDDQTDADLVPADGAEKPFQIADGRFPGGKRELNWTFHSRAQCIQCHHFWAEYALGFNAPQLNRDNSGENQLVRLTELGLLSRKDQRGKSQPPYTAATAAKQQKLADPHDRGAPLADRAKSYFHANCGHCHRFGGGGAVDFELHGFADLSSPKLSDARPTRGTFELDDPRVVAPGDPCRSVLYYRMAKFGGGRMPHLGSEYPDEAGLKLVRDWITSLKPGAKPNSSAGDPLQHLGSPTPALNIARGIGFGTLPPADKNQVLAAAAKLPPGNVRDLFEGFLLRTGERKLGTNPRPRSILTLTGDPGKGRELFATESLKCATCHKVEGKGTEVGPDLSDIGKKRSRDDLLDSLLDPSRRVDPQYQTYLLRTDSGQTFTGLQVRKTEKELVLRDAQNKEVRVPADDIESFTPARPSLMPDGLLRDLTPQQAADLLAYLASRK